jgi:hypothetical protein
MSSSANPTPVVVHVVRPYADEQEYLSAEAWSIEARGMLLIDARPLPPETPVLFDVSLSGGQKPIRAEGRVVGSVSPRGERPGGLRVRFRRFGSATKAFIEKAVALRGTQAAGASSARVSLVPEPPPAQPRMPLALAPEQRDEQLERARRRAPGPVAAPLAREELLERLRKRSGSLAS